MPAQRKLALILLLALCGCDDDDDVQRLEPVPLDKLPAGSLETATKALPGVKFDRARKAKFQGQDAYEIIGKDKHGKIREVEMSTTGAVLEIE